MDVMDCCRICLQFAENMSSIFGMDICGKMTIINKIIICANIMQDGDIQNIPQNICLKCLDDLHIAHRFKMNCEAAAKMFKSFADGQIVTDLIMSSKTGEIFKYEAPKGLKVRRFARRNNNVSEVHSQSITIISKLRVPSVTKTESVASNNDDNDYMDNNDFEDIIANEDLVVNNPIKLKSFSKKESEINDNTKEVEIKPPMKRSRQTRNVSKTKRIQAEKLQKSDDNDDEDAHSTKFRVRKTHQKVAKPLKICEICGNTYKFKHSLESHMRRHRNEKPFSCEICGRSFVLNFELRRHMRTHTGQKPYACQYCERRYSDFGSRIKHERTHTGERPYSCETCGKSFAYSHVLASHILIHTGEKRFGCEECGKRFTKAHHLKAHKKTHSKLQNRQQTLAVENTKPLHFTQTGILVDTLKSIVEGDVPKTDGAVIGVLTTQPDISTYEAQRLLLDDVKLEEHFANGENIKLIYTDDPEN